MAQLSTPPLPERWNSSQTRAQYSAIAWLRWRMWVNGLRRKGSAGELVARIITVPIAIAFFLAPTLGAGVGAWYFASQGQLQHVSFILWGVFAISQLMNINLGQPGTTFDPTQLIRFPMRLASYVSIRLFFGLLAPANIVAVCMSLAVATGVSIALPSLWPWALLALVIFAATNVLFTRMVFAWVDRWLSTRRAREIFTALIFAISLGFQYVNVKFNPAYNHHHAGKVSPAHVEATLRLYRHIKPWLALLPPGLTSKAVVASHAGYLGEALLSIAGCAAFGAVFLGVFALRMRAEFHGEGLSDAANAVAKTAGRPSGAVSVSVPVASSPVRSNTFGMSPAVSAVLGKEFLYLRRNTGLFYSLVAPIVMVLLFAGRLAARSSGAWVFPAALAYTLMGLAPLAYNSFGLEGAGTQFFFMAPVRLRDVFLAKNLMSFMLGVVDVAVVFAIITYIAKPPSSQMLLTALLWALGTLLINTTVGNLRSVAAPKKINLTRMANKQASPLSALMSVGLLIAAAGLGAFVLLAAGWFQLHWILVPVMLGYAVAGLLVYLAGLRSIDHYALDRREQMFEELCKQS